MLYDVTRAIVSFASNRFYRVRVTGKPPPTEGPVLFVANHPNSLMDPVLVFTSAPRRVTFMAKAPLFQMPVLGNILRAMDALPVYRKQDDPGQMGRNEATFDAAITALAAGRAVMLFPEGRSHSEPAVGELKTGAARIALRAARRGVDVLIVPVGLTYAEKDRFRSEVRVEYGEAFSVGELAARAQVDEVAAVQALTERIDRGLRDVTLNLEAWEDLPVLQVAEALYALRRGPAEEDTPARLRAFAAGAKLLRTEQPARFEALRSELAAFSRRLHLVHASPDDLTVVYRRGPVWWFAVRNLVALLLGFPLFFLGVLLFAPPFLFTRALPRWTGVDLDMVATVKFLSLLFLAPLWWALLTALAVWGGGVWTGAVTFLVAPWLALFTRYFFERRRVAIRDARTFFVLGSRARLKARLLVEGEALAAQVVTVVDELAPRLTAAR